MAFCDSLESLSLLRVVLTRHPPACSDSLLVQSARILGTTPCGMEAIRAESGLGFVICVCSCSSLAALASPASPAGRVSQRFHQYTGLGERTEAEKCKEFLSREAKTLPGFGAAHSSASAEEPDARGRRHERLGSWRSWRWTQEKPPPASCPLCLSQWSPCASAAPPLPTHAACGLEMLHGCSRDCGL